jgi:hypothetical protein
MQANANNTATNYWYVAAGVVARTAYVTMLVGIWYF